MGILQNVIKGYYKRQGYEVVLRKYKIQKGELAQAIVLPRATYAPWAGDANFLDVYNKVQDNTLVDIYRCYEIWQLVKEQAKFEGDFIEIGVWRGGTGAIMAKAANTTSPNARVFLCDTFEGVVKAGEHDNQYVNGEHADTSQQIVADLIKKLNANQVEILKGMFPDDTGHHVENRKIKLCHIDVDVYEGAREITEWVWEKLVVGGIIIYDDFGFSGTQGVTKYVEAQRGKPDRTVIHNINGHGIILKLK